MNAFDRVMMLRDAGGVRRWHTEGRWIGERQTVGHHTFGVLLILTQITPSELLTPRLIKATLSHDLGERVVGDVPSPTKWWLKYHTGGNPLDSLEQEVLKAAGVLYPLTTVEDAYLAAADALEFCMEATDQYLLGNIGIIALFDRMERRGVRNEALFAISPQAKEIYDGLRLVWAAARKQQEGILRTVASLTLRKLSDPMDSSGVSSASGTGEVSSQIGESPNNANRS